MSDDLIIITIIVVAFLFSGIKIMQKFIGERKRQDQAVLLAKDFEKRQANAIWASAIVLRAQGGVITGEMAGISHWARYDLNLEVKPPSGEEYMACAVWLVEVAQMSMIQQGQSLSVRIDQQNLKIIYPNVGWAKFISGG